MNSYRQNKTIRNVIDSLNTSMNIQKIDKLKNKTLIGQNNNSYMLNININDKKKDQTNKHISDINNSMKKGIQKVILKNKIFENFLHGFTKKYLPPISYKIQKDIIVINFSFNLKIIIYGFKSNNQLITNPNNTNSNNTQSNPSNIFIQKVQALIIHRTKLFIYDLEGKSIQFDKLPKVIRYVIQKKINTQKNDYQQQNFINNQDVQDYLHKLPNQISYKKQGIILKYGTNNKGYFIAKSFSQDIQYLASLQQRKLNTLFKYDIRQNKFSVQDGPVLGKIYTAWTHQIIQHNNRCE